MLFSQYHLVRIASNNFISISYCKFLFNLITSFKINWYVLLLRKTISRQRNPLTVFCRMMQVPVYSLCRPLLKLNSAKIQETDYSSNLVNTIFYCLANKQYGLLARILVQWLVELFAWPIQSGVVLTRLLVQKSVLLPLVLLSSKWIKQFT